MALPDRIDFTILSNRVLVLKLRRVVDDTHGPRDIPLPNGAGELPDDWNLAAALDYLRDRGYHVREVPGRSARAWLGDRPWPIRTRAQIIRKRADAERAGWGFTAVDFAYDG